MKRRRNGRMARAERARNAARLNKVDLLLARFFDRLPNEDVKWSDYARLADLGSLVADEDEGEVVVRWVAC